MSYVGVIGQGYVGLPLSIAMAEANHRVIGYDNNATLIGELIQGKSHIEDVTNSKLMELIKSGFYLPTTTPSKLNDCEIIVIALPTPLTENKEPDLKFIYSAVDLISNTVTGEKLIINESTSYPGTLRNEIAKRISAISGINHRYASAPERIDPGNKVWTIKKTPRIIAGLDFDSLCEASAFYSTFTDIVIRVSSPEVAEMSKLVENSFRQVNIAFVNEVAQISERFDISVSEVLEAAASKPYGFMKFLPGAGVGGHCIPIDPIYLAFESEKKGIKSSFIKLSNEINESMPLYVVSRVAQYFNNNLKDKKILIIGLAYKSDVSDTRESPAIKVIKILRTTGALVAWHDNLVKFWNGEKSQEILDYDIAIIVTKHANLDLDKVRKIPYVFDCLGSLESTARQ